MDVRRVSIDSIHLDPGNARSHGDENMAAIEASLRRFGQVEPLVIQQKTGRIIGGNGRVVAMKKLGWTDCDVVYVDGKSAEIYRRKEAVFDYDVLRFSGIGYVVHPTLFLRKSLYDRLGLYNYKRFLNCCDGDLLLRIGQARCRVGHVPAFVVNYRFHQYGQSADMRVYRNTEREWRLIQAAGGGISAAV